MKNDNFVFVPSVGLYVTKEKVLLGENRIDAQKILHPNNKKMLAPFEFKEFLKYAKQNYKEVYDKITKQGDSYRAEWIDGSFRLGGKSFFIDYHSFDEEGNVISKSEILDADTLMKDMSPGISLEGWLEDSTKQGLPRDTIKWGDLHYWSPMGGYDSAIGFVAHSSGVGLSCDVSSFYINPDMGVRIAMKKI